MIDKSVDINMFIDNIKVKNINMSLIREKTKVFKAAFIV